MERFVTAFQSDLGMGLTGLVAFALLLMGIR